MATDPKQRKRKRLAKLTRDRDHITAIRGAGEHRSGFSTSANVWCFTMPFFSNVFKNKDGPVTSPNQRIAVHDTNQGPAVPPKPRYASSWNSKEVVPEEVQDLIHACTQEMKSRESKMTVSAFDSFIPMCVESEARRAIIYDFFDLLSAIAAHGKINGLGGRKLSRMAGWWAFDHSDDGKGFEGGYKSWA
ncbi:hypothetical protein LTR28_008331, partial [Elasticomyces elasticus]